MTMVHSLRARIQALGLPRQFWLLFWGMLLNTAGGSMVWPFLTIYLRQRLGVPLTTVTLLMTLNSAAALAAVAVAGPVVDRFGRKWAMVFGLAAGSMTLATMSVAGTLPAWAILMACQGAFGPMYRVGADAMIADMVEPERRPSAYALVRMITNLGVAIGPSVGGFVAARSYALAFYIAAAAGAAYAALILVFARETMPERRPAEARARERAARGGGYDPVLRDRRFMAFCGLYTLAVIPSALMMLLLPVYAKEQFGVPESQYGLIMATNAAMVVLFQYAITQVSKGYPPFRVLAVGAVFYAAGVGSVALGGGFAGFWLSMVVLTIGELLLVPTASTLTAALAPTEMRGRYMGVYNLTWGISYGLGPVIGALLNDRISPVATWYGGLVIGLTAAAGFAVIGRRLGRDRSAIRRD
jgi:MFS family permease